MFLQEKVNEINEKFKELKNVSNITVWGAGAHTCKLFEKTELLSYPIKNIVDMDRVKQGNLYFGFIIKSPDEVVWNDTEAVVISVPGMEKQIAETVTERFKFVGIIITLYEGNKCTPFYHLYDKRISEIRYIGDYSSWDDASDESNGYDDTIIINKVINSTRKVLDGSAVWERDSYLFYDQKYVYSICAAILRCALKNDNRGVRILDIGGALGSTYFQNRRYLTDVRKLEYVVAEQDSFADYGHKYLENEELRFINSREDYAHYGKFDIVLMSASLQYISQYKEIVTKIIRAKPNYIILDRILVSDRMRICRETVPEEIYKSSYPVMIYSEEEIIEFFEPYYEVVEKDVSSVPEEAYFVDGKADSRFFVFRTVDVE